MTLSCIKSFNDTLKQTALTWKKYNKGAVELMGRFDNKLNVTSKNIPFFFFFFHCLWDNLARAKGRERGFWAGEKYQGCARKKRGERLPLLNPPSHVVPHLNSLPFPFKRLPRNGKERCVTRQNDCMIIVSSRKMLPHKAARETLREKKEKKKAAQKGMDRTNMSR